MPLTAAVLGRCDLFWAAAGACLEVLRGFRLGASGPGPLQASPGDRRAGQRGSALFRGYRHVTPIERSLAAGVSELDARATLCIRLKVGRKGLEGRIGNLSGAIAGFFVTGFQQRLSLGIGSRTSPRRDLVEPAGTQARKLLCHGSLGIAQRQTLGAAGRHFIAQRNVGVTIGLPRGGLITLEAAIGDALFGHGHVVEVDSPVSSRVGQMQSNDPALGRRVIQGKRLKFGVGDLEGARRPD